MLLSSKDINLLFSLARRPVRTKHRKSVLSARSMSIVSSEEGEASEYPSSQRSTIESNPEQRKNVTSLHPGAFAEAEKAFGENDKNLSKVQHSSEVNH